VPLFKIVIVRDAAESESKNHRYEARSGEIVLIIINSILFLIVLIAGAVVASNYNVPGSFFLGLLIAAVFVTLNLRLGALAAVWCERLDAITFPVRFKPWTDDGLMEVGAGWLPVLLFWIVVAAYIRALRILYPTRRGSAERASKPVQKSSPPH
jgi:hypothetical protein